MKIPLKDNDFCIDLRDDWLSVETRIYRTHGNLVGTSPIEKYSELEPVDVYKVADVDNLVPRPYSVSYQRIYPRNVVPSKRVQDLASNLLRASGEIEIGALLGRLTAEPRFSRLPADFIELCIKGSLAMGAFIAEEKGKGKKKVLISLSSEQAEREKARLFAGSLAEELSSLSDRIRMLIGHTSTVGTYRENILQSLLRKHLPKRYHVATGFIYGCPRQIDVVIYDGQDYAPIFREGDLVVVPAESVRAAIEVKTKLTHAELRKSLALLADVSQMDDNKPPFFKGLFAFESAMSSETLAKRVIDFYRKTPGEVEELEIDDKPLSEAGSGSGQTNGDDEESVSEVHKGPYPIVSAFGHLTSMCILKHSYLEVDYTRDDATSPLNPTLFSYTSETALNIQPTLFLDLLLNYLRVDTLKPARLYEMTHRLGTDVKCSNVGDLSDGDWGPYFALADGIGGAEELIKATEAKIDKAWEWLAGRHRFN
ncbi:hypothetical protein PQQ86_25725 [Paraburkholderia sediminicola]|uniref:DUF6602 domain-containing protein n=1 Tax=Paraburkholderia sediminicola TaxID=458836 RepID=UPI0038B9328E